MGLEDAAAVRALWRRQRELERVLADRQEIEPVKAESLRELEEVGWCASCFSACPRAGERERGKWLAALPRMKT